MKKYGVNVDFSILKSGYFNQKNADVLIDAGIAFMSGVHSNYKVYTSIVAEHRSSLECRENFLIYNGRFYYMKCVPCKIGEKGDKDAFAYLGLDLAMRDQQKSHLREKMGLSAASTNMDCLC